MEELLTIVGQSPNGQYVKKCIEYKKQINLALRYANSLF